MSVREREGPSEVVVRQSAEHQAAALARLEACGYVVREDEYWIADAGALHLMGASPLTLLGLHAILEERGLAWETRPGEPNLDDLTLGAEDSVQFDAKGEVT